MGVVKPQNWWRAGATFFSYGVHLRSSNGIVSCGSNVACLAQTSNYQTRLEISDRFDTDICNPLERLPYFRSWIEPAIDFNWPSIEIFVESLNTDISYTGGKVVSFNVVWKFLCKSVVAILSFPGYADNFSEEWEGFFSLGSYVYRTRFWELHVSRYTEVNPPSWRGIFLTVLLDNVDPLDQSTIGYINYPEGPSKYTVSNFFFRPIASRQSCGYADSIKLFGEFISGFVA